MNNFRFRTGFNLLGAGLLYWINPWALAFPAAWVAFECVARRQLPGVHHLRNAGNVAAFALASALSAGLSAWLVGWAMVFAGGPIIAWDGASIVRESPLAAIPVVMGAMFLHDLLYYWYHRIQHATFLWQFHAVHHSDRIFDPTTSNRHPLVEPIMQAALLAVPLALLKFEPAKAAIVGTIMGQYTYFTHSSLRIKLGALGVLFVGPQYHRVHHSIEARHYNKNLCGTFPIIDMIFGTYYRPAPDEWPDTGVEGAAGDPSVLEMAVGQAGKPDVVGESCTESDGVKFAAVESQQ